MVKHTEKQQLPVETGAEKENERVGQNTIVDREAKARGTLKDFLTRSFGIKDEREDSQEDRSEPSESEAPTPETPVLSLLGDNHMAELGHLNEYMEYRTEKMGTTVDRLPKKQYEEILEDSMGFKEWLAEKLVSDLIASRKAVVKKAVVKKEIQGRWGQIYPDDDLGRRAAEVKSKHPTTQARRLVERQLIPYSGYHIPEKQSLQQELWAAASLKQNRLDRVIATYESAISQLRTEGASETAIKPLEQALDEARASLTREAEESRKEGEKALEMVMTRHRAELEELRQREPFEVEGGIKREISLSLKRWGEVLKDVIKDEELVTIENNNVKFETPVYTHEKYRLVKKLAVFFDQEIDKMNGVQGTSVKESGLRKLNLDAVIQTDDEARLAEMYLTDLAERLVTSKNVRSARAKPGETTLLAQRFETMSDFLFNSKCVKGKTQAVEILIRNILRSRAIAEPVLKELGRKSVDAYLDPAFNRLCYFISNHSSESVYLKNAGAGVGGEYAKKTILPLFGSIGLVKLLRSVEKAMERGDQGITFNAQAFVSIIDKVARQNDSGLDEAEQRSIRERIYEMTGEGSALTAPIPENTVTKDFCSYEYSKVEDLSLILTALKKKVDLQPEHKRGAEKKRLIEAISSELAYSPWSGDMVKDPEKVLRWERVKVEKLQALVKWSKEK